MAQQVHADGSTESVSGTIDTGILSSMSGYGLFAEKGGTIQSTGPVTINTGGPRANPVNAESGGKIFLTDGATIRGTGISTIGLSATGTDSEITVNNADVEVNGTDSIGASAVDNGLIRATGGAITGEKGVYAFTGGKFIGKDVAITASGTGTWFKHGVEVNTKGSVELTGGSVTTTGERSAGLYVINSDTTAISLTANGTRIKTSGLNARGAEINVGKMHLENVSIHTTGSGGDGVWVDGINDINSSSGTAGSSVLTMNGGSIVTESANAYGLTALSQGRITASQVNVQTLGDSSMGAVAQFGGKVILNGGSITTSGSLAHGLFVAGMGGPTGATRVAARIEASGINITTTGDNAYGAYMRSASELQLNNTNITTYGADASGLIASTYQVGGASKASITNSTITSKQAAGIRVVGNTAADATTLEVSLTNSTVSGKTNVIEVDSNAPGYVAILKLTADNSILNGATRLGSGNTSDMTLKNQSVWNISGDSTLSNLSLSNSSVVYTNSGNFSPTTLTVKNNFDSADGTIQLNTVLGDDNSLTDKLVVEGDTNGTAKVRIRNAGGRGAQTINGIKIIDVVGASNAKFSLSSDYVIQGEQAVVGGAYAYTLHKNGITDPNDGDWYLRSQLMPQQEIPLYQAGVPSYEVYPQTLLQLNTLATLQQRVGNRQWADTTGLSAGDNRTVRTGTWGRMEGSHHRIRPATSDSQTNYNSNIYKLQAGVDTLLYENAASGQLIAGVLAQYSNGRTATYSPFGAGKINTNGYGVGATLSWFGNNGLYVDNQLQFNIYDSDLSSKLTGASLIHGNNGSGYALSSELGLDIKQESGWTLTPQVQLIYSKVKFDSFKDAFGAQVTLDKGASLLGRLGLSLAHEKKSLDSAGKSSSQRNYAIVNLYNEFLDGTRVDVAGVGFANRNERLWGGIGAGTSYSWADGKYMVYGQGMLNTSLKNFGDSYTFSATLGIRMAF
ncbi:autotransporter outer membrane beta-barrel domain-containing protein [Herminiimonas glaciei]|uniref:Autotransporter outer membrane beta-barrel domain-containing protein n=1 Tax=Herminiimonas glaciei TaxID=523788 RepID=A0ABW2I6X5_9BURK